MKKQILLVILIIAIELAFIGGCVAMYLNSNYHYSKKLVEAILDEDIAEVQRIIEKKPTCINTLPSILPKWFWALMGLKHYYPLNEACATDNIELIKLLVENGADVNCNDGSTPLSNTYRLKLANWYDISRYLIEQGASLDYVTQSSGGKSSIFQDILARRYKPYIPENQDEVMEAFLYALENCDHSNVHWMRALQHGVSNDRMEIVKLLLEQGYCDVNDTSVGMTALMFAARDSTLEMVQLLLDYGADKDIVLDGKTAYDYALVTDNEEVYEILKK